MLRGLRRSATAPSDQRRKIRPALGPKEMISPRDLSSRIETVSLSIPWITVRGSHLEMIHIFPHCVLGGDTRLQQSTRQILHLSVNEPRRRTGYIPAPTTTTLIPVGLTGSPFTVSETVMIRKIMQADVLEKNNRN